MLPKLLSRPEPRAVSGSAYPLMANAPEFGVAALSAVASCAQIRSRRHSPASYIRRCFSSWGGANRKMGNRERHCQIDDTFAARDPACVPGSSKPLARHRGNLSPSADPYIYRDAAVGQKFIICQSGNPCSLGNQEMARHSPAWMYFR